jgi:hypothetical protein
MYLTLGEYYPSQLDSAPLAPPRLLRELLFECQFDSFHTAVHAEFVEDV